MFNQKIKSIKYKSFYLYFLTYILLILFLFVPTPYEVLLPGGINDAGKIIQIENSTEKSGTFYSSYVSVITKPSMFQFFINKLNKGADFERLSTTSSKLSVDEMNRSNEIDKLYSIQTSIIVAYKEAGKFLTYNEAGVIISYINPDFDAYHDLVIGDIVTAVNGQLIKTREQFSLKIDNISCNQDINLTILRNNKNTVTTMNIVTNKSMVENICKLGVSGYNYFDHFESNPKFVFADTEGLGSSAGLMQTLSIYNSLIEEDLTHGLKIAGTGVIDINGEVRPIAGIKQKVFGAIENDIDIYFAPNIEDSKGRNLYDLAIQAKGLKNDDIIIVPVKTFADAVNYLKNYQK